MRRSADPRSVDALQAFAIIIIWAWRPSWSSQGLHIHLALLCQVNSDVELESLIINAKFQEQYFGLRTRYLLKRTGEDTC